VVKPRAWATGYPTAYESVFSLGLILTEMQESRVKTRVPYTSNHILDLWSQSQVLYPP
jgi:hypothetical protein